MRAFEDTEVWLFDLDNTLYPASCRLFDQVDRRIHSYIEDFLNLEPPAAAALKKAYYQEFGSSMRGLMLHHAMEPRDFLDFVHDIDFSSLETNPRLRRAIAALPGRRLIFTNASHPYVDHVLEALGLSGLFEGSYDIVAADYRPKPDPASYEDLLRRHDIDPQRAAFFEDSARNLVPAAALGMRTCWVHQSDEDLTPAQRHGPFDLMTDDLTQALEGLKI